MPDFGDERVMGCSLSEFERWLRELTGDASASVASGLARVESEGLDLRIVVTELPARRVALLAMPQLSVRFEYPPDQADAARRWIRGFDRHTQRGGG